MRSNMVALKDKRRRCEPKAYKGIQPTHPESMEGMRIPERSQHKQDKTSDCIIPSNDWLRRAKNKRYRDEPSPSNEIKPTGNVNLE